jgi:hypothetical protein
MEGRILSPQNVVEPYRENKVSFKQKYRIDPIEALLSVFKG